jgi:hypothetical protein
VNDGKLFEKLKDKKGYLNGLELKRLDRDFSLKILDKYDFSGYDEEDTLAYFVKSGPYLWVASCYLGEDDDIPNPFFCLKETGEKGYKMIQHGLIPTLYGECSYELEKLLILKGDYVFVSQKSTGSGYCDDSPLVFTTAGKKVRKKDDLFRIMTRNCSEELENSVCFDRDYHYSYENPYLLIHIIEKETDVESEQEIASRKYNLRFVLKDLSLQFVDTLYK